MTRYATATINKARLRAQIEPDFALNIHFTQHLAAEIGEIRLTASALYRARKPMALCAYQAF